MDSYFITNNELYHYGVLGIKWGVRKDPSRTYSKASQKLRKLDSRTVKLSQKQIEKQEKADKLMSKATTSKKYTKAVKAKKAKLKADKAMKKAIRWSKKMTSVFDDVKISNLDPTDIQLGKQYADMLYDKMREGYKF